MRLRCPAGDDFGTLIVSRDVKPGEIRIQKRCRSHRCRISGHVTFHEFDPTQYDPDRIEATIRTWHVPYRGAAEIAEKIKEIDNVDVR